MNKYFALPFRWLAWWSRPGSLTRILMYMAIIACFILTYFNKGAVEYIAVSIGCVLLLIVGAREYSEVPPNERTPSHGPYFKI